MPPSLIYDTIITKYDNKFQQLNVNVLLNPPKPIEIHPKNVIMVPDQTTKTKEKMMNEQAVEKFEDLCEIAKEYTERIYQYFDDHAELTPDDVDWAWVDEMKFYVYKLKEIKDRIDGTGEYAE